PDLTVIMPVFNEKLTVQRAIEQVLDTDLPIASLELIVVDDGSTDGTGGVLASLDVPESVVVQTHEQNAGKGAAIRTGLLNATGRFTAIVDADLELDPADLSPLLVPLLADEARVVFGARVFPRDSARKLRYLLGNKSVTVAANILFRSSLTD